MSNPSEPRPEWWKTAIVLRTVQGAASSTANRPQLSTVDSSAHRVGQDGKTRPRPRALPPLDGEDDLQYADRLCALMEQADQEAALKHAALAEQRAACADLAAARGERAERRYDDATPIQTTVGDLRRMVNEMHRAAVSRAVEKAVHAERERFIKLLGKENAPKCG